MSFWYFPSDLINRKWSNWPKCPKMSCFYEQACTCHISQTEWHTHLNLKASERYGSLNVPFGIFSPIRSTGSYRSGHYVQGLRFSKQAYMGHISGTERPIQLILVSNEKYRCLGVHIGTSGQIWSTGMVKMAKISPNWAEIRLVWAISCLK